MSRANLVFVVAHPDDVAHAMGGTAWLLKRVYALHVFCATRGEHGIPGIAPAEAGRIREREEAAACALLDAQLTFLDQIDGHMWADEAVCTRVANALQCLQPRAVFTLWPINRHLDHVLAHCIAVRAMGLAGIADTAELYMGENAIGLVTRQFDPDMLVDISDVIEQKKRLVRCHASQNTSEVQVDGVIERNVFRGRFASCAYAEAFKTMGPVTVQRDGGYSGGVLAGLRAGGEPP